MRVVRSSMCQQPSMRECAAARGMLHILLRTVHPGCSADIRNSSTQQQRTFAHTMMFRQPPRATCSLPPVIVPSGCSVTFCNSSRGSQGGSC